MQIQRIKDVTKFYNGYAFKSKNYTDAGEYIVRIGDIKQRGIDLSNAKRVDILKEKKDLSNYQIKQNSILLAMSGATTGKVSLYNLNQKAYLNQRVGMLVCENNLLPKYLYYFLSNYSEKFLSSAIGAAVQNLSKSQIENTEIPVPPLQEQEKIVERLDKVFKNIDKSTKIIENNIQNIQMIYSSSLNKNTEKDLTNEFSLGDLCEVVTKGTTPTSVGHKFIEGGINFIKIECINSSGEFLHNKFSYISEECHETLKRSKLAEGDILFSIAGALGRTALVTNDILPANTNQALAIIRLKKNIKINADYLIYVLNSKLVENQSNKFMAGVAQQNLSLTQLKNYKINLPSIKIQNETVVKIDLIKNQTADLGNLYLNKLTKLKALKKSILFNAFSKTNTPDAA